MTTTYKTDIAIELGKHPQPGETFTLDHDDDGDIAGVFSVSGSFRVNSTTADDALEDLAVSDLTFTVISFEPKPLFHVDSKEEHGELTFTG